MEGFAVELVDRGVVGGIHLHHCGYGNLGMVGILLEFDIVGEMGVEDGVEVELVVCSPFVCSFLRLPFGIAFGPSSTSLGGLPHEFWSASSNLVVS